MTFAPVFHAGFFSQGALKFGLQYYPEQKTMEDTIVLGYENSSNDPHRGRSTDRGVNWSNGQISAGFRQPDDLTPMVLGPSKCGFVIEVPGGDITFVFTTNGGSTWSTVLIVDLVSAENCGSYAVTKDLLLSAFRGDANAAESVAFSKSLDGGSTWSSLVTVSTAGQPLAPPSLGAFSENDFVAAWIRDGNVVVFGKSDDQGSSWTNTEPLQLGRADGNIGPQILVIDKQTYVVVYLRNSTVSGTQDLVMQKTTDGGSTWGAAVVIESSATSTTTARMVDKDTILVTSSGTPKVWKSTNQGSTWSDITPVISPSRLSILVLGALEYHVYGIDSFGIIDLFKTTDGGSTWTEVSDFITNGSPDAFGVAALHPSLV